MYSDDEIYTIQEFGLDIHAREIWLTPSDHYSLGVEEPLYSAPGVEYTMASQFLKNLKTLEKCGDEPILIHLKTNGGEWHEGMAIYDAIKFSPCLITILNYTEARSMSSLIFSAGDKRVMMPHSSFMFHDGTMGMEGTVKQFLNEANQLKKTGQQMMDIYTGVMRFSSMWADKSEKDLEEWLRGHMDKKEEVYLSAKEAVKYGFADEVFSGCWDDLLDHYPREG